MSVRFKLCAIEAELCEAWEHAFHDITDVEVLFQSILTVSACALVSPANSFGYMDGGLDLRYSQQFGWDLERRVREAILEDHHGELPVGNAVVVPTGLAEFRWLVCAPTMRVPSDVSDTVNAYLAFRGLLRAVEQHNQTHDDRIRTVACPGLGTGEGRLSPARCARQMRYAYDVVVNGLVETKGGLARAVRNHLWLLE